MAWVSFRLGAWGLGRLETWAAWVGGVGEMGLQRRSVAWFDGVGQQCGPVTLSFGWTDNGETKR